MTAETDGRRLVLAGKVPAAASASAAWSLRAVLGAAAFVILTVALPLAFSWTVAATFYTPKLLPLYVGASIAVLAGYGLGAPVRVGGGAHGSRSWRGTAVLFAGAFLLWGVVSVVTATGRWTGALGTYDQGTGWLWMAASLATWAAMSRLGFAEGRLRWLLRLFLLGGIVAAVLGLLTVAHWEPLRMRLGFRGDGRASSTLGNPLYFGSYLSLVILVAFDQLAVWWGRARAGGDGALSGGGNGPMGAILPAVAVLVGIAALISTLSRGAWLGVIVGSVVWVIAGLRTGRVTTRPLAVAVGVLILVVIVAVTEVPRLSVARLEPGARVGAAASDVSMGTVRTRWYMWGIALHAIADRPIWGWGPNNYRFAAAQHMTTQKLAAEPGTRDADAHDLMLELASTWGIPGALLFLAWFATVLVGVARAHKGTAALALGLAASYFVASATMPQNVAVTPVVFALLGILTPRSRDDVGDAPHSPGGRLRAWQAPLALSVGVVGVAMSLFWGIRMLDADSHYLRGVLEGNTYPAVHELSSAVEMMPVIETYWAALGVAQLRVGGAQPDAAFQQAGLGSLNRALGLAPRDVDTLDALARAYLNEGDWDAARAAAEKAVSYAPIEPAPHADLSYALLRLGDRSGALREAQLAVAVDTGTPRIFYEIGLTYRDAGDVARARQMLEKALALSPAFTQARRALDDLSAS